MFVSQKTANNIVKLEIHIPLHVDLLHFRTVPENYMISEYKKTFKIK